MKHLAFFIFLLIFHNVFSQTKQFEGTIIYEVRHENELQATEIYYFKDHMLRKKSILHPDSDTLTFVRIYHFSSQGPDTIYAKLDPSNLGSIGDSSFRKEGYEMHVIKPKSCIRICHESCKGQRRQGLAQGFGSEA